MEKAKHLTEDEQPKHYTRSAARHLRRKRFNEARRAEKRWLEFINDVGNENQEPVTDIGIDKITALTKSKARRLRKKNKAKQLQSYNSSCCCFYFEPNIFKYIEGNQEEPTYYKQCAFCLLHPQFSDIDKVSTGETLPLLCKQSSNHNQTVLEQKENYFNNCETADANHHKQKRKVARIIKAQTHDTEHVNKVEQSELKLINTGSEEDLSDFSQSSDSSISSKLDRGLQIHHRTSNKRTPALNEKPCTFMLKEDSNNLFFSSGSSTSVKPETVLQVHHTNHDNNLPKPTVVQFNNVESNSASLESINSSDLVKITKFRKDSPLLQIKPEGRTSQRKSNLLNTLTAVRYAPYRTFVPSENKNCRNKLNTVDINDKSSVAPLYLHDHNESIDHNSLCTSNIPAVLPLNPDVLKSDGCLNIRSYLDPNIQPSLTTYDCNDINSEQGLNIHITNIENPKCKPEISGCIEELTLESQLVDVQDIKAASCIVVERKIEETAAAHTLNTAFVPAATRQGAEQLFTSCANLTLSTTSNKMADNNTNPLEKTRGEVKASREAKKAAKAAAKAKAKAGIIQKKDNTSKSDNVSNQYKLLDVSVEVKIAEEKNLSECENPTAEKNTNSSKKDSDVSAVTNEGKTKAAIRAERRAKQEAQRTVKQGALLATRNKPHEKDTPETIVTPHADEINKKSSKKISMKENTHEVNLFKHLYHERELAVTNAPVVHSNVHPAILRLGIQYANKIIVGSNARCVALLAVVKQVVQDFMRPPQADFIRGFEAHLQESMAYLHCCRPLAVSMQNALKHLKWQMTQLPSTISDKDAKNKLRCAIDTYILEQIQLADKAISITIQTKISNGNVILTYGYSSLIHKILWDAHVAGKQFRVVVVDGRPWLEGKEQLRRLAKHGIECSYILINALSYIMPEVSKVFLGAHAILANGAVMSRVGTAQIALMARAFNVPVLVACETHKSCERVQTDSIVYNELGNADELTQNFLLNTKQSVLANWRTKKSLNLLNITYDVTPADLVTAVVTELAILPCTSVPVILRIKPSEI